MNSYFDRPTNSHLSGLHRQTEKIACHYLKHNQSYVSMEEIAKIMNTMENASIRVPETKYKIKKLLNPQFKNMFQILCSKCGNYTPSYEKKVQCANTSCSKMLRTSDSKYFIYISLEQQLRKAIHDHWDEIMENRISKENIIADVHDAIQFKQISDKLNGFKMLSLVVCTDGANVFSNHSQSLWAIQLYQNYLNPKMRYVPKNVLVNTFYCDEDKPNMRDFFHPMLRDLKAIHLAGGLVVE